MSCTCPVLASLSSNSCCNAQLKTPVLCVGSKSTRIWRSSDSILQVMSRDSAMRRMVHLMCYPVVSSYGVQAQAVLSALLSRRFEQGSTEVKPDWRTLWGWCGSTAPGH